MESSEKIAQDQYASFLIRLWLAEKPTREGETTGWHIEIEHIQSGQSFTTNRFEEVPALMQQGIQGAPLEKDWKG